MKIIGHRGAKGLAPENTLAGFKKALELGVDEIEFDVRVSKDSIPLLNHNLRLIDDSGNRLKISDRKYEELKMHKPDLTTLQEALDFVNGKVLLYIEVKPGAAVMPIVRELTAYKHPYLLASKSQATLLELNQALPSITKRVIESWSGMRAISRAKAVKTKQIAMNQSFLWSGFIRMMSKRGYQLIAYTLNNPTKARRWAKHGMAGIVTDFPDRFKQ